MKDVTTIGVDLAKDVFQLHGTNAAGEVVLIKRIKRRSTFNQFLAKLPPCSIGMEACASAHYWARQCLSYGHQVKLMHAKYVKAFVERNKHDAADAKACHRALCQPDIPTVPVKTEEQQALLLVHTHRRLLMKQRTQVSQQLRASLLELGYAFARGEAALRRGVTALLGDDKGPLPLLAKELFVQMLERHKELAERIEKEDKRIESLAKTDERCQRLLKLPGVGPITATAFAASMKGYSFTKGRQTAAWLGLTPKESSSGKTRRLLGISKQGNRYLRTLFIHGARSVVRRAGTKTDELSIWINRLNAEKGFNKAVVALANKTARRAWSMLQHETTFDEHYADYYELAA